MDLLLKFPWLMSCPFEKVEYDSRDKTIYIGDYYNKRASLKKAARNVGKYRVYYWDIGTSLSRYGKIRYAALIFVVDTRTHEVGMVNPLFGYPNTVNIEKELELLP